MNQATSGLLLATAIVLSACKPTAQVAPPPPPAKPVETAPAMRTPEAAKPEVPSLVVDTFDGGKFDLAQHRGNWVVVNFWATWCTPCLKEIPDLDAVDESR